MSYSEYFNYICGYDFPTIENMIPTLAEVVPTMETVFPFFDPYSF